MQTEINNNRLAVKNSNNNNDKLMNHILDDKIYIL